MIPSKKLLKLFVLFLTASTLFDSAIAITGNGKRQEKLDKYKTPELVYFVDTVLNYLEKNKDVNPRHLTLLKKCQSTLNSNKKRLIGMEVVNIKQCKNLSTAGIYNVKFTNVNSNTINILGDKNEKNNSNRNEEYLYERETDNLKNQIEKQLKDQKLRELQELREKQLKEQKELQELREKQLKEQRELQEKQLKERKVKELEELLEELKKNEYRKQKSKESNIKDKTDLLFD